MAAALPGENIGDDETGPAGAGGHDDALAVHGVPLLLRGRFRIRRR